jgi:putative exporter of polyketide antibiotics
MVYFVVVCHFLPVADISVLFPLKGKVHKFHSFFWKKTCHPFCAHCLGDLLLFLLPKWLHELEIVNWEKKLDIILDIQRTYQLGIPDTYH